MHDEDGNPSFFAVLLAGAKEGYEQRDAEIKKDQAPLDEKVLTGFVTGASETAAHPFLWLRALLGS
jgi:hypothetical protein